MKTERTYFENKLKTLETSTNFVDNPEYTETNEKLDKIYNQIVQFKNNFETS